MDGHLRADLIEVFKILRGVENVDPEKFLQVVRDDGRRRHSFKLFKRRYRLDVGRFKFGNRVCEEWNGLDDDVVAVGSVNVLPGSIHEDTVMDGHRQGKKANAYKYPLTFLK